MQIVIKKITFFCHIWKEKYQAYQQKKENQNYT